MLVYSINLFIVILAAHLAYKARSAALSRLFIGIAFMSMIMVAGLRDKAVGTDTGGYVGYFNSLLTFDDVSGSWKQNGRVWFLGYDVAGALYFRRICSLPIRNCLVGHRFLPADHD